MTLDELIQQLQALRLARGNVNVLIRDFAGSLGDVAVQFYQVHPLDLVDYVGENFPATGGEQVVVLSLR